jgi:hypothetical protein
MGTSNNKTTLRAMPNSELGIKGSELFNEFVKYEKEQYSYDNNIDLREYSVEGWWRDNDIYKSDNSMISEIQKKLSQFNFMLDNPDAIQTALDKLDPNSRPEVSTLHNIIKENELPEAQLALKIFDNYKIYNSLNIRG